jgi:hypothetical protein
VKYRVNLYRERHEKALQFRRGLLRGALVTLMITVETSLLVVLFVSGFQMNARAAVLRREVETLEARARRPTEEVELEDVRLLLRARVQRIDWAPTLSAVAHATPSGVVLTEIRGGIGGEHGRMDGLEIEGRVSGRSLDLDPVLAFIEALQADTTLSGAFPRVDLGTAKDRGNTFQIICRRGAVERADEDAESAS